MRVLTNDECWVYRALRTSESAFKEKKIIGNFILFWGKSEIPAREKLAIRMKPLTPNNILTKSVVYLKPDPLLMDFLCSGRVTREDPLHPVSMAQAYAKTLG